LVWERKAAFGCVDESVRETEIVREEGERRIVAGQGAHVQEVWRVTWSVS
jgi:hypothetical protein